MRIVKAALAIVALAAPVASARAQEAVHEVTAKEVSAQSSTGTAGAGQLAQTEGWNAKWALLFQVNNILANPNTLGEFGQMGIGAEYFLGSDLAARVGFSYGRTTNPRVTQKRVDETAGTSVETYTLDDATVADNNPTSTTDLNIRADMLYRLMPTAVAPYVGGGFFYSWSQDRWDITDDVSTVDQVTKTHNRDRTQDFGVRGVLGAEWRLHSSFSLFAEYALGVTLISQRSTNNDFVREVTVDGEKTVRHVKTTSSKPAFLGADTNMTHAGQLGLAIHF